MEKLAADANDITARVETSYWHGLESDALSSLLSILKAKEVRGILLSAKFALFKTQ